MVRRSASVRALPSRLLESLLLSAVVLMALTLSMDNGLNGVAEASEAVVGMDGEMCADEEDSCGMWADMGECHVNPNYMLYHCKVSCATCEYVQWC